MAAGYPPTHPAVVVIAKREPLAVIERPTKAPGPGEVVVRVQWMASSPLELHQADGGLLIDSPHVLGSGFAGVVVATGPEDPDAKKPFSAPLVVGDRVMGFTFKNNDQRGYQTYVTVPRNLMGRVPEGISLQAATTVPGNLVTAFHTITKDLGLELPWPIPAGYVPPQADSPILVWGAASSVGMFILQVLQHWGYKNTIAVASKKHHEELKSYGAKACFDYREADVTDQIRALQTHIPYIVDCIGHVDGTLRPLSKVATRGSVVAVMLPVIIRDATADHEPVLGMDPNELKQIKWEEGVTLRGVRTFFYDENDFFRWHLQPDIIPEILAAGVVKPNRQRIVEGATLLERAQKAIDLLRERAPSGERLVWRVSEEGDEN
ncbi:zinc-binding dehydrogenase [Stachybotrys elegans]|uniref:Zinc-binding dehydrogenase n=1 Tax=Stachybotrys elegans TaxID=80388 RepID=A0A8K0SX32_9HYPO|nr:zinc-binding dehydrogenase [Stachybotrys elegans]